MRSIPYYPLPQSPYAFGTGYAIWSLFLNLDPAARVLVIGGDPDLCHEQLAPRCGELLVLLDETQADQAQHPRALVAPLSAIPVETDSLDCVFLAACQPGAMEQESLAEIERCLKPGGQLFLGAQNALNLEGSSIAQKDRPGPVAQLLGNQRDPALYSARDSMRRLKAAGLAHSRLFGVMGQVNQGQEIIPYDRGSSPATGRLTWRQQLKRSSYLVPAFGLVACHTAAPEHSYFSRILAPAIASSVRGADGSLQVDTWEVTGKRKLLLHATCSGHPVVARFCFDQETAQAEKNSYSLLQRLAERHPEISVVPRPVACGPAEGQEFFVETRLSGSPLRRRVLQGQREGVVAMAIAALRSFNAPDEVEHKAFDGDIYEHMVASRLRRVDPHLGSAEQRAQLRELFSSSLRGKLIPRGLSHGDFSTSNILVDERGQLSAVVDWETGSYEGLPALDGIGILVSVDVTSGSGLSVAEQFRQLADGQWPDTAEYEQLLALYDHLGVSSDVYRGLVYLYWLHVVDFRLRYGMQEYPSAIAYYLTDVVDALLAGVVEQD